jgi:hypothetical protein
VKPVGQLLERRPVTPLWQDGRSQLAAAACSSYPPCPVASGGNTPDVAATRRRRLGNSPTQ